MLIFCICQTAHFNGTSSLLWAPSPWSINSDLTYPQDQWELALLFNFPLQKKKSVISYLSVCLTAMKGLMRFSFWTVGESLCNSSGYLCCGWAGLGAELLLAANDPGQASGPRLWIEGCSAKLILPWDWSKCIPRAQYGPRLCLLPSWAAAAGESSSCFQRRRQCPWKPNIKSVKR